MDPEDSGEDLGKFILISTSTRLKAQEYFSTSVSFRSNRFQYRSAT
jgi:hypothetical protein